MKIAIDGISVNFKKLILEVDNFRVVVLSKQVRQNPELLTLFVWLGHPKPYYRFGLVLRGSPVLAFTSFKESFN